MLLAKKALATTFPSTDEEYEKWVSTVSLVIFGQKTTDKVLLKLLESPDPNILRWILEFGKPGEAVLKRVVEKCVEMNQYSEEWMTELQAEIAELIVNHNLANADIMFELVEANQYKIWKLVAFSQKSESGTLQKIAQKCVSECSEEEQLDMLQNILLHPANTDEVVLEFASSTNKEVVQTVYEYLLR